jgi:hypothetical protein
MILKRNFTAPISKFQKAVLKIFNISILIYILYHCCIVYSQAAIYMLFYIIYCFEHFQTRPFSTALLPYPK